MGTLGDVQGAAGATAATRPVGWLEVEEDCVAALVSQGDSLDWEDSRRVAEVVRFTTRPALAMDIATHVDTLECAEALIAGAALANPAVVGDALAIFCRWANPHREAEAITGAGARRWAEVLAAAEPELCRTFDARPLAITDVISELATLGQLERLTGQLLERWDLGPEGLALLPARAATRNALTSTRHLGALASLLEGNEGRWEVFRTLLEGYDGPDTIGGLIETAAILEDHGRP